MSDVINKIKNIRSSAIIHSTLETSVKNSALKAMAEALDNNRAIILEANAKDVFPAEKMKEEGKITEALVNRLRISDDKISSMIDGINDIIKSKDPVGETISTLELDDDLILYQVKCPIGVLGVIFESRPDVVTQIMSLCLKSGNGVVFKGGSEAFNSNRALFDILNTAAISAGIPEGTFVLLETREDISLMLELDEYIDLLIPRGSNELVKYIQTNTNIPVLGHAAGICHAYVDDEADLEMAVEVCLDSKIQYAAVCNALETLLVNSKIAKDFLPMMAKRFVESNVEIRADSESRKYISAIEAKEEDWDEEYNELIISIKVVEDLSEAIEFINLHGSHHTDCIITTNKKKQLTFIKGVDSSSVIVNTSTRFPDGYRYGKGAEVGISTNKIHSRGPMGMEGLMIYKYVLIGKGHVVKDYSGKGSKKFKHKQLDEIFKL